MYASDRPELYGSAVFNKEFFPDRRTQVEDMELKELKELEDKVPSDLTDLGDLTPITVLDVVKKRFKKEKIYTSGGGQDILLSVNPYKDVHLYTDEYHEKYKWETLNPNDDPHIFCITTRAYKRLLESKKNQVVLFTGESGSGKTENTKLMVKHLIWLSGNKSKDLHTQIVEVNPLVEAFGNAKTILNNNSSRFAKYLEIGFEENGQIVDATIRDYMLEKSRVVLQSKGEGNFHVFYSLLAGIDDTEKRNYRLYLNQFRIAPKPFPKSESEYAQEFKQQIDVMRMIGLTTEEIDNIKTILAAILHMTNIEFSSKNSVTVDNEHPMFCAATLLEIDVEQLANFLVIRKIKVGGEVIDCPKTKAQADEGRDAVAKFLFERLFGWLVRQINTALHKSKSKFNAAGSIGILDICGFETLRNNGFEQLCINLVNEKLQMFMNDHIFRREKEIFESEGLEWSSIEYTNNQDIVEMFLKEKTGILHLIDEDTKFQQATDQTLVCKLDDRFGGSKYYHKTKSNLPEFYIQHFAGSVKYNAVGFLEKNGNELSPDILKCLVASDNELVSDLFTVQPTNTGTISGTPFQYRMSRKHAPAYHKQENSRLIQGIVRGTMKSLHDRFGNVTPHAGPTVVDLQNQKTVVAYFKNSMKELLSKMSTAEARFVRCIKPNGHMKADEFDEQKVLEQLQYNGIAEMAQIRKLGYPIRIPYSVFMKRYELLEPACKTVLKKQDAVKAILDAVDAGSSTYQLGKEQVFLKEEISVKLSVELEKKMEEIRKAKEEEERRRKEEEERKRIKEEEERRRKVEEERKRIKEEEEERKRKEEEERKRIKEEENKRREKEEEERSIQEAEEKKEKNEEERRKHREEARQLINELGSNMLSPIVEVSTPASSFMDRGIETSTRSNVTVEESSTSSVHSIPSLPPRHSPVVPEPEPEPEPEPRPEPRPEPETKKKHEPVFWDIFRIVDLEMPMKDVHEQMPLKVVKMILYLLFFLVLLGSCVMHKVSLMVYLPQLKPDLDKNGAKTVLIILVVVIPYSLTTVVSFLKWLFGVSRLPSLSTFTLVFIMESLHSFGMCLLIFRILPNVSHFTGISLLSAVGILPGLLKLVCSREVGKELEIRQSRLKSTCTRVVSTSLDILAVLAQLCIIFVAVKWDFIKQIDKTSENLNINEITDDVTLLSIVGAFLFVSFGCWENFVDDRIFCRMKSDSLGSFLLKARYELQEGRSGVFMVTHLWKIILTFFLAYLMRVGVDVSLTWDDLYTTTDNLTNLVPIFILGCCSIISHYFGYIACKLRMQIFSFSIPLLLSTPAAYCVFVVNCNYGILKYIMTESSSECPQYLNNWDHLLAGLIWWASLMWISRHIWFPRQENLAKFERLFINPMYCGILTTENLLLNRRRHTLRVIMSQYQDYRFNVKLKYHLQAEEQRIYGNYVDAPLSSGDSLNVDVPRIYACATMWHENRNEMVQLLKSLHRLDADQWNRKEAMMISCQDDPNFYEYEAHIFFDDAMEVDCDGNWVANSFVKMLISLMGEACSSVHNRPMTPQNPYKVVTPYGAQFVWQMPGENLLYVHVKDKNKIRSRKRWSQVMYMYYLLGYRLTKESQDELVYAIENDLLNSKNRRAIFDHLNEDVVRKSENTFILALDGDTDFMPGAVRLLVDRMQKGRKVGAACGRIHPTGSGPLVWYQQFEYAIGHWLQKATEHVLGCVLCSPGCFSLFRGSALMDDNIIRKYAITSTEPGHYLQYDQGEDRWLCTLLLQQGYRVDYVAGADAFTHAPEGFNELFNQRRRWMPSTLANVNDLLGSASITIATNSNISRLFIWYQFACLAGTILGPGTTIMMIAGSIQAVIELDLAVCYVIGILPPALFVVLCYFLKAKYQLVIASALSIAYAFLMIVVLIGSIITAVDEGPLHPNVIFFLGMILIFVITALLHFKEFYCLLFGLLYMICLPAGYLILVIYSLCNLHTISWGTRETPKRKTQQELDKEKETKEKKKDGFFTRIFRRSYYTKQIKEVVQGVTGKKDNIADDKILQSLNKLNKNILRIAPGRHLSLDESSAEETDDHDEPKEEKKELQPEVAEIQPEKTATEVSTDAWLHDPALGNGPILVVNEEEGRFWKLFLEKYLAPLEKDEQKEKEIKAGLLTLRDDYVFMFVTLNGLWIALNYVFQQKNRFAIPITYYIGDHVYNIKLQVLGMLFIIFFLFILIIQFIGMFLHRWGTLQHMVSVTELNFFKTKLLDISDPVGLEDALKFCQFFNHEPIPDYGADEPEARPTALESAVVLGKSIHIKPELGKSIRETLLAKGQTLSQSRINGMPDLMMSMKRGIPLYLRGAQLAADDSETEGNAVSFVRNLRQSMVAGKINRASIKPLPSCIRRRHLGDATDNVINRVRGAGVQFTLPEREEEDESHNDYESLDAFGDGSMGRSFARRIKYLKDSLQILDNRYGAISLDLNHF